MCIRDRLKKALPDIKVELVFKDGVQHVYLNGEDVSEMCIRDRSRSAGTLSGGESQRIRLATQIGSSLMGCLLYTSRCV